MTSLALVPLAHAQTRAPIDPARLDRSLARPGARSLGLGGSYLIAADDASAAVWNPAALARTARVTLPLSASIRTDNLSAFRIPTLINRSDDLSAEADSRRGDQFQFVQGAFNSLYDIARDAGARPDGEPTSIRLTAVPLVGVSFGGARVKSGLTLSSGVFGEGKLGVIGSTTPGARALSVNTGILGMTSLAIPVARDFGRAGTFGISAKYIRTDYAAINIVAAEGINPLTGLNNDISGTTYDHATGHAVDLDFGYISPAIAKLRGARAAVAVRHLLSPKFTLNAPTRVNTNNVADTDFSFRQRPQIDVGLAAPNLFKKTLVAAELHNLSGANGGDLSLHVGAEYQVNRRFAVRAGFDEDQLVGGFGYDVGATRLDLAIGTQFRQRFALGLSSKF